MNLYLSRGKLESFFDTLFELSDTLFELKPRLTVTRQKFKFAIVIIRDFAF